MNRPAPRAGDKDAAEPARPGGTPHTTFRRTSREELLARFRVARRRLGAAGRP
jgi:hypothetical protein